MSGTCSRRLKSAYLTRLFLSSNRLRSSASSWHGGNRSASTAQPFHLPNGPGDAAGLSIVHVNRTFQELRRLNILPKEGRSINVVDRERLAKLAGFDGNYLNMPQLLSHWQVKIERTSAPALPMIRSTLGLRV